jgi:hypothetical protein
MLNEKGCLFLKSVFTQETIEDFNKDVRDFMVKNEIYTHLKKRLDVQEETFYVNNTYSSLNSFQKIQYYYLPVIDNRGSYNRINEVGMIDFYNVVKLFPNITTYFNVELMQTLLKKITGTQWKLFRCNLQLCSNVANPYSFHSDNQIKCIRITIYLSDIEEESYGPPVYIENTHNNINDIKNENIKIFTGNKGDILIAYQSGLHCKLPQKINTTVGFLTFNFIPV